MIRWRDGSDVYGAHLFNDVDDVTDLESQFLFKLRFIVLRHFDSSQWLINMSYKIKTERKTYIATERRNSTKTKINLNNKVMKLTLHKHGELCEWMQDQKRFEMTYFLSQDGNRFEWRQDRRRFEGDLRGSNKMVSYAVYQIHRKWRLCQIVGASRRHLNYPFRMIRSTIFTLCVVLPLYLFIHLFQGT